MFKNKNKNFLCLVFYKKDVETPVKIYTDDMSFLKKDARKIDRMHVFQNVGTFFKFVFEVNSCGFPLGIVDFYVGDENGSD